MNSYEVGDDDLIRMVVLYIIHAYNAMKTEANAVASGTSNCEQLRGW